MNAEWTAMLRSVEKRRDKDARFFKPTALLAVIDGIADGSLSPSDIDPDRVVARFEAYLAEILPARSTSGWRPFWHLSRDGAWQFEKAERAVGPEDFRAQRKPNSRRELMAKIDHVFVPPSSRSSWRDPVARAQLRGAVIAMLAADDADSRLVAAHLATPPMSGDIMDADAARRPRPERGLGLDSVYDDDAPLAGPVRPGRSQGQGFQSSSIMRRAVEERAMAIARQLLEDDGYSVHDVSLSESYDFHATKGADTLRVEVKGTAGLGDRIILTRAEVAFARRYRDTMMLVIVSDIELAVEEGKMVASGGSARTIMPWAPASEDLDPISFFCRVDRKLAAL